MQNELKARWVSHTKQIAKDVALEVLRFSEEFIAGVRR